MDLPFERDNTELSVEHTNAPVRSYAQVVTVAVPPGVPRARAQI